VDLALVDGRLLTMDPRQPVAEAALVRNGRIVLVDTTRAVRAAAPRTTEYDCRGRTVVPGFIDGHAHFEMTCAALACCVSCTTPPYRSLAEIAAALRERVATTPKGEWIVGRSSFGLYAKVTEGRLFTRHDLDAVTQDHPLVVLAGLHVAMLNTRALEALGLWEPGAPRRGVTLHRDGSGVPTGVATEIWDRLPTFPKEQVKHAIRQKARELFSANGVTSVHTIPSSAADVVADRELHALGELPLRLRLYYHVPRDVSLAALTTPGLTPGFGDERLRFGGVKIFVDGTGHDGYGNRLWDVKWSQPELDALVSEAHRAGLQLWMHVNAVPTIQMATAAVEQAVRAHPGPHRHRLEHGADFIDDPADMERVRAAGIRLMTTPQFIRSQGDVTGTRFPRLLRLRTLIDHGFELIGSSDSTGTVPDGIAPLFNIACAVARRTGRGREHLPHERITVDEGLKMYTIWAAKGAFEEREKGSISAGKLGDFAVLPADPREVPPEALLEMRVDATICGGEVVYER
jgi:predicted amidohydrolase YtcJ